jgi:hypothetical protein
MNAVPDLTQRVALLEDEVQALRQRVSQLEQPDIETNQAATIVTPAVPTPEPKPAVSAMPPPLPLAPENTLPVRRQPEPAKAAPPPLPQEPSGWQELLGAMKLLPPKRGESGEAQIGGWWATRVGALLAVIGVVFFGIYISASIAPWMKWLELAAIAGSVLAGGHWLERRGLRVGPVVIGAGHALIFFTAFAASAVEAVRIVTDPVLAITLQAAAAAFIAVAGWRRDSATTATMGVVLGYVAAFFSLSSDLQVLAGSGGVILAMAAVILQVRKGWWVPVFISAVLTPILCLVVSVTDFGSPSVGLAYGLILAGFLIHLVVAIREGQLGEQGLSKKTRRLQAVNTSLSLLAGLVATLSLSSWDALDGYFLGSGIVLLAVIAGMVRRVPGDRVIGMWTVKAASLFALAAIAHWDAHSRWVALMVEALVLVAAAQRSDRNSIRAAAIGAWALSLVFFLSHFERDGIAPFSVLGWIQIGYVVAGLVLFELLVRQWRGRVSGGATMEMLFGGLAALPLLAWLSRDTLDVAWGPVGALAWTLLLAAWSWRWSSRVALPALGLAFGFAQLAVFAFNETLWGTPWLWAGAGPLGWVTLVAGWTLARQPWAESKMALPRQSRIGLSLILIALAGWAAALMQTFTPTIALAGMAAVAVGLAAIGLREREPTLTTAAMASLILSFALSAAYGIGHSANESVMWSWLALASAPLLWAIGQRRPEAERAMLDPAHALVAIVAVPLIFEVVGASDNPLPFGLILTAIGGALGALAIWLRLQWPLATASVALLWGLAQISVDNNWMGEPGAGLALVGAGLLVIAVGAFPLCFRGLREQLSGRLVKAGWSIHALAVAGAATAIALNRHAVWSDYGTVLWAVGGILLFGLGIIGRARVHRLVGLVLLVLCIPRAFVHDIEEAKHRIAAFIVLGLLLLWVGFSYQKFRHLIENKPAQDHSEDS